MGALCGCCLDRKPRMPVVDWEKLKEADEHISQENDMRKPPPKSVTKKTNIKTPLLAAGDQTGHNANRKKNSLHTTLSDTEDAIQPRPSGVIRDIQTLSSKYNASKLEEIVSKLKETLNIKDRKFHLKVYPSCFIASDMVDKLIELRYAESEQEAIEIGHSLHYFSYIQHVSDDNKLFKNKKDRFWKFVDNSASAADGTNTNNETNSSNNTEMDGKNDNNNNNNDNNNNNNDNNNNNTTLSTNTNGNGNIAGGSNSRKTTENNDFLDTTDPNMSLRSESGDYLGEDDYADEMASELSSTMRPPLELTDEIVRYRNIRNELIKNLELKDQKWMLKIYKECATAHDICKTLIKLKIANNYVEAVAIGQKLLDLRLMVHCSHKKKIKFENEKTLFLHFINFDMKDVALLWKANNYALKLSLIPKLNIKDRTWVAKKYEKCFKGSVFVKALIQLNVAMTILHAREIGTELIRLGHIQHVAKDQTRMWNNDKVWYCFAK